MSYVKIYRYITLILPWACTAGGILYWIRRLIWWTKQN